MKTERESGERENGPADSVWEVVSSGHEPQFSEGAEYSINMCYGVQAPPL